VIVASCAAFERDHPTALEKIVASMNAPVAMHRSIDEVFPDGEISVALPRGTVVEDVLLLQSLSTDPAALNDAVFALLSSIRMYRVAGATRIAVFVPHLAYSREERPAAVGGRVSTTQLLADLIRAAGAGCVITAQSGSVALVKDAYKPLAIEQLDATNFFVWCIESMHIADPVLVAPDRGAADLVRNIGARLGLQHARADKQRKGAANVALSLTEQAGSLKGREVIIIDDLVCSAGTLDQAVCAARKLGACRVTAVAAHLRLTHLGISRIRAMVAAGHLAGLVAWDTCGAPRVGGVQTFAFADWLAPELCAVLQKRSGIDAIEEAVS
jgi:ribose-phosphate pyrophosphokinase